ncbi:aminotransferase class III-fold pyridoxal phosphate-dependent enzyme [Pontibacter sp. JH31]|uniref:Aminotransferase class III-fold pyridoxal phosphate-dependent enzyme n=1 Tax=Pontibacter aquaedesilientis TaxID=2766980 RepID=A0ABR7XCR9_9BACT|nr:aminotransferase class III-fold pyridoxal phosphate-dependent enzyme [Pontibacter aquaedesilientis]MBD1396093.1 aminotransferase class III-fold pyridoxal phosphate-dependent enzyme [Pontibacter aquaedesilientis]
MNLFDVYPLFDIEPVRAAGLSVWDKEGRKYLDLYGGHAVISIGHSHPHYVKRIARQLYDIGFYSNAVQMPMQQELAEKLGQLSGYPDYSLFLCNSGAEANENALKLASFQTGRKKVITFKSSFHGRTSAAVAATDDTAIIAPINETENIIFLPFNDAPAFEKALQEYGQELAAVIVEGIQGVGGVNIPEPDFLKALEAGCKRVGALLILDEVQSGYGRSGKFFAHQHAGIKPDLITVAKGMGNGFPVGGVLISPEIDARHGMLGTTFGGNYLACAASLAVLEVIENEELLENATIMGHYLKEKLQGMPGVKEVRGQGLMIGIELYEPCAAIRKELLNEYCIFTGSSSNKNTLRLLPSLTVSKSEADQFLKAFSSILSKKVLAS